MASRSRPSLHGEQGVALTVAIFSLALMITLGGIALNQAVFTTQKTLEQEHVKKALGAADAALEAAAFAAARVDITSGLALNPTNLNQPITQNCVVTVSQVAGVPLNEPDYDLGILDPLTPDDALGRKWCPQSGSETVTPTTSFDFRLSELVRAGAGPCGTTGLLSLDREVVGVGRASGEVRRVKATLEANVAILSGAAVQSSSTTSPLAMSGSARILGDARSNAAITGSATNVISGTATYGHGTSATGPTVVGSRVEACEKFNIPQVAQGDAPTVNDNLSIPQHTCAGVLTGLPVTCTPLIGPQTGDVVYDQTRRTLTVTGNGRATLNQDTYSFCSVVVRGNGVIQIANSSPVTRIFLDDPANCPGVTNPGTINVSEQGRLVNCHLQTAPETLQLYAVGSATIPTTQTLVGTGLATTALRGTFCGLSLGAILGEPMTIIAPRSVVALGGGTAISGQVAAQQVTMAGTSSVNPINALINLDRLGGRPVLPLYEVTGYVECTGRDFSELPANEPAQGC